MTTNPHAARHDAILTLRSQGKTAAQIARELGADHSSIARSLRRMARRGIAPGLVQVPVPDGMRMARTCVYYDEAGNVKGEWRRMSPDAEAVQEWLGRLCEQAAQAGPKIKPVKPAKSANRLLEIPIGDLHMGMFAWAPETVADYNCEIAATLLRRGCCHLMDAARGCSEVMLADLGDFLHADNRHGLTEKSGHILDTDSRRWRVIEHARNAWVSVIEEAAKRFPVVHVVMTPGNHNRESADWMAQVIAAWFRNVPSVRVNTDPRTYRFHRFGASLLGYHHGDVMKPETLANVMASAERERWAETKHHAWRCGHVHHSRRVAMADRGEANGVSVEYFPVLAGRDAWHAEMGYASRRMIQGIIHDPELGEVERHTVHAHHLLGA